MADTYSQPNIEDRLIPLVRKVYDRLPDVDGARLIRDMPVFNPRRNEAGCGQPLGAVELRLRSPGTQNLSHCDSHGHPDCY